MKFYVNEDCIGCGLCPTVCPEVFELTDEGVAHAAEGDVAPELESSALLAKQDCPVSAIESDPET